VQWLEMISIGRTGSTILSAIIGSHPNVRFAEEQQYSSKWLREGWTREQILEALTASGVGKARRLLGFPDSSILTYNEPLKLIGDKSDWGMVNAHMKRGAPADILSQFSAVMGMPVKALVSIRNPFETLATRINSEKYTRKWADLDLRTRKLCQHYRKFHNAASEIVEGQDYRIVPLERLIADPSEVLNELTDWLDLPTDQAWKAECLARLFKKPRTHAFTLPEPYLTQMNDWITSNPLMTYYR